MRRLVLSLRSPAFTADLKAKLAVDSFVTPAQGDALVMAQIAESALSVIVANSVKNRMHLSTSSLFTRSGFVISICAL